MNKFGFATIAATGLAAAVLGFAAPAAAMPAAVAPVTTISTGIDHNSWLYEIQPRVSVPQVDTTVRQSR